MKVFPAARILLGDTDSLCSKPHKSIAPCEQRLWSELEMLEMLRGKVTNQDEWWECVGNVCKKSYWAFLRIILGYRWCDPYWHGEVITRFIEDTRGMDRLIILPRDSGKTASVTVPYIAYKVACDPASLCQITNAAEDKAWQYARTAAKIIENNTTYQRAYPKIRPSSEKWGKRGYEIDTTLLLEDGVGTIERTDPTINAYGTRGNITGAHVSLQMHDDLINHETIKSPVKLSGVEGFLKEAFRCCVADGEIFISGTRWLYHDIYGEVLNGRIKAHKGRFAVLKHGIFKANGEICWPQRSFIDQKGAEGKAGYTNQQVEGFKSDPLFPALYLCEPKSADNSDINAEMIHVFAQKEISFETGPVQGVYIESANSGHFIIDSFKQMLFDEGRRIRVEAISTQGQSKDARIKVYLGNYANLGKLHVAEEVWRGSNSLGTQIQNYPAGKVDLIDAAAYVCKLAKEPPPGEPPRVIMVCDPAFSEEKTSDFTAIVCGVRYLGDVWILDAYQLKTTKVNIINRQIIKMHDKWENSMSYAHSRQDKKPSYTPLRTFNSKWRSSSRNNFRVGSRTARATGSFYIDSTTLTGGKKIIEE